MAVLAISAVGAGIGYASAGYLGIAAATGASYGWMIGSLIGSMLFQEDVKGPKLEDLKVQSSTYGTPIPIIYGLARVAGNIIWATDLVEHTEEESAKGGPSVETTTYTVSCAVGICEGSIIGVRRIWANKKLVYDIGASNTGPTFTEDFSSPPRVYLGSESQSADSLIVAHQGSSPAYRGLAYVVIEDFQLANFGNRTPQFEFEVLKNGTSGDTIEYFTSPDLQLDAIIFNPLLNEVWVSLVQDVTPEQSIARLNAQTGAVNGYVGLGGFDELYTPMRYDPAGRAVWAYNTSASELYMS